MVFTQSFSKEGTSYVTSDGEYIFTGNLFKVKGTEVEKHHGRVYQ
uniref:Thiol:disulfide interchange protein DsbC n=1 Tax=Klebsiella pneumoniae TaxID=573 RepID=A0A8B0SXV2_KLEPN|nr:Thiol:disulfide interchange protein DsbC [Klebsiella pneumoniae]